MEKQNKLHMIVWVQRIAEETEENFHRRCFFSHPYLKGSSGIHFPLLDFICLFSLALTVHEQILTSSKCNQV